MIATILVIMLVYAYDQQVLYYTAAPIRYALDISLFIFIFIPTYSILKHTSVYKYKQPAYVILLPGIAMKMLPLLNTLFLFNTLLVEVPSIGTLNENMFIQSLEALPFYTLHIFACLVNGLMLLIALSKEVHVNIYDVFVYSIAFIALQTLVPMYGFHLAGLKGLRILLICIFIIIPIMYIYRVKGKKSIVLECDEKFPLILALSVSTFAFYYPCALYSHYSDQAVMLASVNSIFYRGSLEPYYEACGYYPAIGGFYIASFIYTTGLSNTILASTLSFMVAYLFLPIVTYRAMKLLVNNGSIALVATLMAIHMDGLGIVAYPLYKPIIDQHLQRAVNNLIYIERALNILNFDLSRRMCSLYSSSIVFLWFTPYKVLAILASVAAIVLVLYPYLSNHRLALSAIITSITFLNPRMTLIVLLTFTLLWGLKRLKSMEILILLLISLMSLGPLLWTIIYKVSAAFIFRYLARSLPFSVEIGRIVLMNKYLLKVHNNTFILAFFIASVLYLYYRARSYQLVKRDILPVSDVVHKIPPDRFMLFFIMALCITLASVFLYINSSTLPYILKLMNDNYILYIPKYLVMRYHIMTMLSIFSLLLLKLNPSLLLSLSLMLILTYIIEPYLLSIPLVILSIPTLTYLFRHFSRGVIAISLLSFIILGILTNGLYGAVMVSSYASPIYVDIPYILEVLLKCDPDTQVYPGSYYNYFVWRTLQFAQLRPSDNLGTSDLYLIDRQYGIKISFESNIIHTLYSGRRLLLLKRENVLTNT